jgi:hypothetical protein
MHLLSGEPMHDLSGVDSNRYRSNQHKRRTMSAVHPMATELSQCRERCSEVPIATNAPQQTAHKERPPTAAINL